VALRATGLRFSGHRRTQKNTETAMNTEDR
jgi:hypothetical protein